MNNPAEVFKVILGENTTDSLSKNIPCCLVCYIVYIGARQENNSFQIAPVLQIYLLVRDRSLFMKEGGGGQNRCGSDIHFLSKLGVGHVSLSSEEGWDGGWMALIECQEYQTKLRKSEINSKIA